MPELPEVENVRRTLLPLLKGERIHAVTIHRSSVVRRVPEEAISLPALLLEGARLTEVMRRGKQLALIAEKEHRSLHIHLGMSGSLRFHPTSASSTCDPHTHVVWQLAAGQLHFRDPRRFGGLWPGHLVTCSPKEAAANQEAHLAPDWGPLGEDALTIGPAELHQALQKTSSPLKAALLDQHRIAGLGNIYVDELLFASGLSPQMPARAVDRQTCQRIVRRMRRLLEQALAAGGSTLRDYVDGAGERGRFQHQFQVYSRWGQPCFSCGTPLTRSVIVGRTTVSCSVCQPALAEGISTTKPASNRQPAPLPGESAAGAMVPNRKRKK